MKHAVILSILFLSSLPTLAEAQTKKFAVNVQFFRIGGSTASSLGLSKESIQPTIERLVREKGYGIAKTPNEAYLGGELRVGVKAGGHSLADGTTAAAVSIACSLYGEGRSALIPKMDRIVTGNAHAASLFTGNGEFIQANVQTSLEDGLKACVDRTL